jgi:hypothetical protein
LARRFKGKGTEMTTNTYTQTSGASSPDITVCTIQKNHSTQVRVTIERWKGITRCHVREYFPGTLPNEWRPGKGACVEIPLLPELAAGLGEAERVARERGLLPSEDRRAAA